MIISGNLEDEYMNTDSNEFFLNNDNKVNDTMCKILLWLLLIFPALFLLSFAKVFKVSINYLLVITPVGAVFCIVPTILKKFKVAASFIKYWSVFSMAVIIAIMGCNFHIGIYMTFVLAMALSCMYFDVKLTRYVAIFGYVCMVLSVFIRAHNAVLPEGDTVMSWFRAYTLGYTMEYIVMAVVFINIAKKARYYMESLNDTEKVQLVVDNCEEASQNLSVAVDKLHDSLKSSKEGNMGISQAAVLTFKDCSHNEDYIKETIESINRMAQVVETIIEKNEMLKEASDKTFASTKEYIMIMDGAVATMNTIDESTKKTLETITILNDRIEDIEQLTNTISAIANETSMLSLNASIEAARAGENGKGFAVVAGQVRKLAEESHSAVASITKHMESFRQNVLRSVASIKEETESVKAGILYITNAKDEAVSLGTIQENSLQIVDDISHNCTQSKECVEQVISMASNMESLMKHSSKMITDIKDSLEVQNELIDTMSELFEKVNEVSNRLEDIVES